MSEASIHFAGAVLLTVPTLAFGGARLLRMIWASEPGYLDNPVGQSLWRAGHAHAGVLVALALVASLLVDHADLTNDARQIVRVGFAAPPILMPLGFFLSVASPRAQRPNRLIYLVPCGGLVLGSASVMLGIGLLGA
jgi:hypothetical protein